MSENLSLLVIGAASDMAQAVAREFAAHGYDIQLASRKVHRLERDAADIAHRHNVGVSCHELELLAYNTHPGFFDTLPTYIADGYHLPGVGLLGDQVRSQTDPAAARLVMESNYILAPPPSSPRPPTSTSKPARAPSSASVRWPGPGQQLRLRLRQGGLYRFPVWPAQPAAPP